MTFGIVDFDSSACYGQMPCAPSIAGAAHARVCRAGGFDLSGLRPSGSACVWRENGKSVPNIFMVRRHYGWRAPCYGLPVGCAGKPDRRPEGVGAREARGISGRRSRLTRGGALARCCSIPGGFTRGGSVSCGGSEPYHRGINRKGGSVAGVCL